MTTTMQPTTTTKTLIEQFATIRRTSTPLVIIRTTDPQAVSKQINDWNQQQGALSGAVIQWDAAAGFRHRNAKGKEVVESGDVFPNGPLVLNAADAMHLIKDMPKLSIVFAFNAHRVWQELPVAQAMWNLRDSYKNSERTLVMFTTPEAVAPRELESDVIVIDDPLPTEEQIAAIVTKQCNNVGIPVPTGKAMTKAVDALKGLSAFVVEQITAMALRKSGIDMTDLWTRKIQKVEETPGASVYKGDMTFASIGGHEGIKTILRREIKAKRPVKLVVVLDEFEKMIAGGTSDHVGDGGVAKDASQVVLTRMQDKGYRGLVAFGHPGTGKTALAKAMAAEADVLCIMADMGAMKGGVVGESEAKVRAFFNLIDAIAGDGGAFLFATCNSANAITSELRRRFKTGFFFVDLPTREEKDAIWAVHMKRFGLKKQTLPADESWTGSEIEVCCEKADNYGITLLEAAESIVPLALSQPELIARRRSEAHNRMLSSQTGRAYVSPVALAQQQQETSEERAIRL